MNLPEVIHHLAEAANRASIDRHGLLPACDLITLAKVGETDRERLERRHRPAHTELPGGVQIRDQRPMPPKALENCLVGMTPSEWYELINRRVFFWLDPDRLNRQRAACEPRPQVVLTIDTRRLVAACSDRIELSPINSGSAMRRAAKRGRATFVRHADWLASGWDTEAAALGTTPRARSHAPAELTVLGPVRVADHLVSITPLAPGESFVPVTG
jgi:hypothetical protein